MGLDTFIALRGQDFTIGGSTYVALCELSDENDWHAWSFERVPKAGESDGHRKIPKIKLVSYSAHPDFLVNQGVRPIASLILSTMRDDPMFVSSKLYQHDERIPDQCWEGGGLDTIVRW